MSDNSLQDYQQLHDEIFKKARAMFTGQNKNIDGTIIRILLETGMTLVEHMKSNNGQVLTGPEKRQAVLMVTKWVISDLAKTGVINTELAADINLATDLLGGVAIDMACTAAKMALKGIVTVVDEGRAKASLCCVPK